MGNRLSLLRKKHKMTQKDLADVLNVSQNTISRWEKGERQIDTSMLSPLADFFNVSIDYILLRKEISTPSVGVPDSYSSELLHFANQLNPKLKERLIAVALILLAEQKGQSVLLESNNGGNVNE